MVLALEQEMDFLWWRHARPSLARGVRGRKAQLVKLMAALPVADADRYARDELTSILQAIIARLPALAFHAVSVAGADR